MNIYDGLKIGYKVILQDAAKKSVGHLMATTAGGMAGIAATEITDAECGRRIRILAEAYEEVKNEMLLGM